MISLSEMRDASAYMASGASTRGGLYRACLRMLELHPGWTDAEIAAALCAGKSDRDVIADARHAMEQGKRKAATA